MSLRGLLFGADGGSARVAEAVARWRALPAVDLDRPIAATAFNVLDLDLTGTDPRQDRVTGVALVLVEDGAVDLGSSLHLSLAEEGGDGGLAAEDLICELLGRLGNRPTVSYRTGFIDAMLERFVAPYGNVPLDTVPLLDLAYLLPAALGETLGEKATLEDWLGRRGIPVIRRHHALADAWGMAQALLLALSAAEEQDLRTLRELIELESSSRRLRR